MKNRIEIHLNDEETRQLDLIAKENGRSRKNYCETAIRTIIKSLSGGKKKKK